MMQKPTEELTLRHLVCNVCKRALLETVCSCRQANASLNIDDAFPLLRPRFFRYGLRDPRLGRAAGRSRKDTEAPDRNHLFSVYSGCRTYLDYLCL